LSKLQIFNNEKILLVGGLGNKILYVLLGYADFYISKSNKIRRWDICPGEALLRCFGGSVTSL